MNLFIAGTDFVCVFFLIVIAISLLLLNKSEKRYIYYLMSIIALIVCCVFDCIAYYMDEYGGNDILHFYSNLISYIGIDFVLPPFMYYIAEKIRDSVNFSRLHARFLSIVCAVDVVVLIFGAYTGLLFSIVDGQFCYGPLIYCVGSAQLFVSGYIFVLLFKLRGRIDSKFIYTVGFYFFLPIFSIITELVFPTINISYMLTSIILLIVYIVIVREDLQTSVLSERIMRQASVTDNLTGMLNRRAYAEAIEQLNKTYPSDFVYMSLDVNGLKTVNDSAGHSAGDEIIVGAAMCMQKGLGRYGDIYRTGGDEFIAILSIPEDEFDRVIADFEEEVDDWHGALVDELSISFGYVKYQEACDMTVHDVAVLADKRMYAAKTAFYKKKGVDRRGQQDAHVALYKLYTKILKINVTDDTYQIINMDTGEQSVDKGFSETISGWFAGFGKSGLVHPDDLDEYYRLTDLQYIKDYFSKNKTSLHLFYRRRYGDIFKQVMMEMILADDYSSENQSLFLYVKEIDK